MAIDILMPALSPTMEEGVLAKWHIKVGDVLKSGDIMCEIETDKATMEVEAVDEGRVLEILVAEGTQGVKVNAVIARIEGEGDAPSKAPAAPAPAAATPAAAPTPVAVASAPAATDGSRIMASPLAKRIAEAAGINLAQVTGTGPHGRIVKADVEAARGQAPQPVASVTPAAAAAPIAAPAAAPRAPSASWPGRGRAGRRRTRAPRG